VESKTIKIKQRLDGRIEGTVNQAFASMTFRFRTAEGDMAEVTLDIESSLDIIYQLDGGKQIVKEIKNERARRMPQSLWAKIKEHFRNG